MGYLASLLAFVPLCFSMGFIEFSFSPALGCVEGPLLGVREKSMQVADGRGAVGVSTPLTIHSAGKQGSLPRLPGTFHLTPSSPVCSHLPKEG